MNKTKLPAIHFFEKQIRVLNGTTKIKLTFHQRAKIKTNSDVSHDMLLCYYVWLRNTTGSVSAFEYNSISLFSKIISLVSLITSCL